MQVLLLMIEMQMLPIELSVEFVAADSNNANWLSTRANWAKFTASECNFDAVDSEKQHDIKIYVRWVKKMKKSAENEKKSQQT